MQIAVYASSPCRQWPRNTRYQAGATPYLGRTFTGWIAPACGWRTHSITSSARSRNDSGIAAARETGQLPHEIMLDIARTPVGVKLKDWGVVEKDDKKWA